MKNKKGHRLFLSREEGAAAKPNSGVISSIDPGSFAASLGLCPGDEIVSVNGREPQDAIDFRFLAAPGPVRLRMRRDSKEIRADGDRGYDEPLGIQFARPTFDGIRLCNNSCSFCSVAQMPTGLRRSLYVKDDDYRYSFLFGNYVTLTNLDRSDWTRIRRQRLSPLFVSVHATETGLRRSLLANPGAPAVMPQLRRLARAGIEVHAQIVVLPGVNDDRHLDQSIGDLAGLFPAVRSLSIVPVALTRFNRSGLRLHSTSEVERILDQVAGWQTRLRKELGAGFAYLSDEWYLRLDREVPPLSAYDGLDLTENGVGLVRQYLEAARSRRSPAAGEGEITLVTGEQFAPVLRRTIPKLPRVRVVPIENRLFASTITAAGLLAGHDVVDQLKAAGPGDGVVLPSAMFGGPRGESLDGMMPADIEEELGVPARAAEFPWHAW
jgi:putative radical SAM enzyme (TIGR03279 family)